LKSDESCISNPKSEISNRTLATSGPIYDCPISGFEMQDSSEFQNFLKTCPRIFQLFRLDASYTAAICDLERLKGVDTAAVWEKSDTFIEQFEGPSMSGRHVGRCRR